MLATLVPTLIEAAFGGGARGFLVGVGVSVLQAAIPLALGQILTVATGGGATLPGPRCRACAKRRPRRPGRPRQALARRGALTGAGGRPIRRPTTPDRAR
jgi:hypothetical protein